MNINVKQKRTAIKLFIIDVLKERIIKLHDDRKTYFTKLYEKIVTPEIIQAHAVLRKAIKKTPELDSLLEMESAPADGRSSKVKIGLLVDICTFGENSVEISGKDVGIKAEVFDFKIKTDLYFGEAADFDDLMSSFKDTKETAAFEARERKITDDVNRLYDSAWSSIEKIRSEKGIKEECPELAPYLKGIKEESNDLADMAGCMRAKDNC